jgi:hypothetical protein
VKTAVVWMISMVLSAGAAHGAFAQEPPPTPAEEQPEILTQGPMHEAFAEPVDLQVQEGLVAPTPPPAEIVERPPAERPAGRRFVWVPGYWAWDPQRAGYVWVSGCWRAAPPDRYWVPGYWSGTDRGWEWVPGFWASEAKVQEIEYLPAPPTIDEVQPQGPAPGPDSIWAPPCWYWRQGGYVWRPGYWLAAQTDWVWVPSHYAWTPRGYVFLAGHWDYSLARRGVLFAPVYFPSPIYQRPGFYFPLRVVVDLGLVQYSLFTCPRYNHYFYGDYYDSVNLRFGIFPWFQCEGARIWYDPIYVHDRWRYQRAQPGWAAHQRREYDRRRADRDLRPPRTYREMEVRQARMPESKRRSIQVAEPLSRVVADRGTPLKYERISTNTRKRLTEESTRVYKFGVERSRWESASAGAKKDQRSVERKRPASPSSGQGEAVAPRTTVRQGSATQRAEQGTPSTQSVERQRSVTPSSGQGEAVAPRTTVRQGSATQRTEQGTPSTQSVERQRSVTPPSGQGGAAAPRSTGRQGSATQRAEQGAPSTQSVDRTPAFAPPREVRLTSPERVKIPDPPVSDSRGALSIFQKGPPSRPAAEQKTEVRSAPQRSSSPATGNRDTQRSRDSSRGTR